MKYLINFCIWALATIGVANVVESPVQMILPINWAASSEYNLIVSIPKGYTSLQDLKDFEKGILIEFVPTGQDGENWSEIITIHKLIGERVAAAPLVQKLKAVMMEKESNGKLLKESYENYPNYQKATFLMSYDYKQHEILGAEYYSGSFDCIGIQYTVRDNNDKKATKKIEKFFNTIAITTNRKNKT